MARFPVGRLLVVVALFAAALAPSAARAQDPIDPAADPAAIQTPDSGLPPDPGLPPDTGTASTDTTEPGLPGPLDNPVTETSCSATGSESLATDKEDYHPEETVQVSGAGFGMGCDVVIKVTRPDGSVVKGDGTFDPGSDTVVTDENGAFQYAYILDGIQGEYTIEALGADDAVLTSMTFTDAAVTAKAGASPAGTTFSVDWEKYSTALCTGSVPTTGTATGVGTAGTSVWGTVASGGSLKLTAAATATTPSPQPQFAQWSITTILGTITSAQRTICVSGLLAATATANYSFEPVVTGPSLQTATSGVSKSFNVGSFTDTAGGPWNVSISWGDGSPDTTFQVASAGSLGTQSHTYNLPNFNVSTKTIGVSVTDTAQSVTNSANPGGSVIVSPPLDGAIQVKTDGVSGLTADVGWAKYSNASCTNPSSSTGTASSVPASGTDFAFYTDGTGPGRVSQTGSLLVTAAAFANSPNGTTKFAGWTSATPFTTPDAAHPETICIAGFTANLITSDTLHSFTADYRAGPHYTPPATQTASPGVSKSFDLGSFSDDQATAWDVTVDWGDGTAPETFSVTSTGTIPAHSHTYAPAVNTYLPAAPFLIPIQTGTVQKAHTLKVTVKETSEAVNLSDDGTSTVNVVNPPPNASYSIPIGATEVGQSPTVAPNITVTDITGDVSGASPRFAYTYLPLDSLTNTLALVGQLVNNPGSVDLNTILSTLGINNILNLITNTQLGLPNGMTVDNWACTSPTDVYHETCTGKLGGKANVKTGVYILFALDSYKQSSLLAGQVLPVVVLPYGKFAPAVTAAQYTDALINSPKATWVTPLTGGNMPSVGYKYFSVDDISNFAAQLEQLVATPLAQWDLNTLLNNVVVPGLSQLTSFTNGLPDALTMSSWSCTDDGTLKTCNSTVSGNDNTKSGLYLIALRDGSAAGAFPSLRMLPFFAFPEDVRLDTSDVSTKPGISVSFSSDIRPSIFLSDTTYGDITKMWVRTQVKDCFSGAVLKTMWAPVSDAPVANDGVGTAGLWSYVNSTEGVYCVWSDLVRGNLSTQRNEWYWAFPSQSTITVTDYSGQFMTGGGWLKDPTSTSTNTVKGHFGFQGRYTKQGSPKGNLVYNWLGKVNGVTANFRIKSNQISSLQFSGLLYPMGGTMNGKASLEVTRASDGASLPGGMGNLSLTLKVVDSNSKTTPDTFLLNVYNGNTLVKSVSTTGTPAGTPLPTQGGEIVLHAK